MKYQVGDLVLIKDGEYKSRPLPRLPLRLRLRLLLRPRLRPLPELFNSYGIITKAINHSDAWEGDSTIDDNVYVWFSQIDGREYFFFQDEVTGEVIK